MSATVLEQLLELQQRPRGAEVLVDAGAYTLGEGERWCRVHKIRPKAKFPVHVGFGSYTYAEIRGIREATHAR